MPKPIVFISHIGEEKEIAIALKNVVESAFLGMIDVFVSSAPASISLGQKWLDGIAHALKTCAVEIIIASPVSVQRPWINFEAGAGWIRDIPVIPLCHSGMIPRKLPAPLSTLQAATATEEKELLLILPVLAKAIDSTLPQIDLSNFIKTVQEFETVSEESAALVEKAPIAARGGLSPHELAALVTIAECASSPDDFWAVFQIRSEMEKAGYRGVAAALGLKMLARKGFVEFSESTGWNNDEVFATVKITDDGWAWLEANKHLLVLHEKHTPQEDETSYSETTANGDEIPF
jgi:hypothetical protein